jgi:hypothetical protein
MALSSEPIFEALFERLQAYVRGVKTFERAELDYTQIPDHKQPALVLVEDPFVPEYRSQGLPPKWTLGATILIYAKAKDKKSPGAILLRLRDQVEAALELQAGETKHVPDETFTSLGGLVKYARISGPVSFWPGATSDQAIAEIPVSMLWPPG